MEFLQTTICEVSGNVSWTGKDDLEPGSVELHHLYPWKNEFKFRVSKAGYIEVSSKLTTSFIYYADQLNYEPSVLKSKLGSERVDNRLDKLR